MSMLRANLPGKGALIRAAIAGFGLVSMMAAAPAAVAGTSQAPLKEVPGGFSFDSPLGKFDQASLQRGYKVYAEVCSSCHSMNLMYYRNLCQPGGPFYHKEYPNPNDSPYCKAIAAGIQVPDIDPDTGDPIQRPATPADKFRNPYPNEVAAAAGNGGKAPPDLSVMARAREGGPQYIYSILSGYPDNPPAGLTVPDGKYYNPYYPGDLGAQWSGPKDKVPPGGLILMPFQLVPDRVSFDDGTKSTTEQQAKDVATFLAWTAEPKQEERKEAGLAVMIYLILFAGVLYLSYRRIWRNVAH
jgi:ubiquinol-cytochrome c reductase cytochrome c1 subunit